MTPTPDSANTLVYVSWNENCPISKKTWDFLDVNCLGFHDIPEFQCTDRAGLSRLYRGIPLDDLLGTFRLVIILLSAKHASSARWWADEVMNRLIPAHERGEILLFWQQIEKIPSIPIYFQQRCPLMPFRDNGWKPNKIKESTLQLSNKIKEQWELVPVVSQSLPCLQKNQPQAVELQDPPLPISHVALVIHETPNIRCPQPLYTFSLYRRPHDVEPYELLTYLDDARGSYPFPWSVQPANPKQPKTKSPFCPVLHRLLRWAQRQNTEFILEIFAPEALLHLNWGELLAPSLGELEPLVQAHPFLLRSTDRLSQDYQSRSGRLQQKWECLQSHPASWTWVDGNACHPPDWQTVMTTVHQVAIQRSAPLAEPGRRDWLKAVLRSMVPLALWPHPSTPPPSPKNPPLTDIASTEDPHTKVLGLCQQALQGLSPRPEPDLDQLAQLRFANQAENLKHYAILVDHPTRRPLLDDVDPFHSSPAPTDLLISC
jgi:hypothetical protein